MQPLLRTCTLSTGVRYAPFHADFRRGAYRFLGVSAVSFAALLAANGGSIARNSIKYAADSAGNLTSFAVNTPAITDLGLAAPEPAGANYCPYAQDMGAPGAGWTPTTGGTGALSSTPATATLTSSTGLPDGLNSDTGKGITCTGITQDPTRSRYLVVNDGRNKDGKYNGTANTGNGLWMASVLALDASLAKIGEWPLIYPGDSTNANRGGQGIAVDTRFDRIAICTPVLGNKISFFSPADMAAIPSATITLPSPITAVNGLAYDSLRDAFWVTDNTTLNIYLVSREGVLLRTYVTENVEQPGIDHLSYVAAGDLLLVTNGANASSGTVWALDCAKTRKTKAMTMAEAKAIEGVCYSLDGNSILVCSDGYFHSVPPGNVPAPYNINTLLKYPASALVAFAYTRKMTGWGAWRGLAGKATRLIMDKGAGSAATDFCLYTATAIADGATNQKTFSFDAWTADGGTYVVAMRLGSTVQHITVTPTRQTFLMTVASQASAATLQIGLRKGGAPYNTDNFADVVVAGLQLEVGPARTSWMPTAATTAATRAAETITLPVPAGATTLKETLADGSVTTVAGLSGTYALPTNIGQPIKSLMIQ